MRRGMIVLAAVGAVLGLIGGVALATPVIGASAETARGPLVDRPLDVNWRFAPGVKLQTKGPIEVAYQRITIAPGGTLGWHSHPGPYRGYGVSGDPELLPRRRLHQWIEYATGQSFSNMPDEIHLARNEGTSPVVVFASYYLMQTSPPAPLRIDRPSPGAGCPE